MTFEIWPEGRATAVGRGQRLVGSIGASDMELLVTQR